MWTIQWTDINDRKFMWKDAVVTQPEVPSWHLSGGMEERQDDTGSPRRDMNPPAVEYEVKVLPTQWKIHFARRLSVSIQLQDSLIFTTRSWSGRSRRRDSWVSPEVHSGVGTAPRYVAICVLGFQSLLLFTFKITQQLLLPKHGVYTCGKCPTPEIPGLANENLV